MKKYVDGEYIEMTEEEIVEIQNAENFEVLYEPSLLERLEAIEALLLEEVLNND